MRVDGQRHTPTALPSGKKGRYPLCGRLGGLQSRYPLCGRLGGLQGRFGRVRKISLPLEFCFLLSLCVHYRYRFVMIVLAFPFCPYGTTHTTQASMPSARFEPAIPASDRSQTFALYSSVIGIVRIWSPDRPALSESLYRLIYRVPPVAHLNLNSVVCQKTWILNVFVVTTELISVHWRSLSTRTSGNSVAVSCKIGRTSELGFLWTATMLRRA